MKTKKRERDREGEDVWCSEEMALERPANASTPYWLEPDSGESAGGGLGLRPNGRIKKFMTVFLFFFKFGPGGKSGKSRERFPTPDSHPKPLHRG